ncbi:hypothetical protein DXG01_010846, partial [Tephrocybe rancida]
PSVADPDYSNKLERYVQATKQLDETSLRWLDVKSDIHVQRLMDPSLPNTDVAQGRGSPQDLCKVLIQREKELIRASATRLKAELELVEIGLAWCQQDEEVLLQEFLHLDNL